MKALFFINGQVIKCFGLLSLSFLGFAAPSCGQETSKGKKAKIEANQPVSPSLSVRTVVMPVAGMSCGSCVSNVKKTVRSLEGVQAVEVSLEKRQGVITYLEKKVSHEQISKAINEKGYKTGKMVEVRNPQ